MASSFAILLVNMEDSVRFWRGLRPLMGTVIGVGIFGLPYVFAQTGFGLTTIELVLVGVISAVTFLIYGDLLYANRSHAHFVAVVGRELGPLGRFMATVSYLGALWGAMLAYILVGGQFAANLFAQFTGWEVATWQVLFWLFCSLVIFGGASTIRKLQGILISIFVILILTLVAFALPHAQSEAFVFGDISRLGLPLGVLLFAFSGFGALAEVKEAIGNKQTLFRSVVILSVVLIGLLYLLFVAAVLGLTGHATTPQAVDGLRYALGGVPFIVVSAIGLCTVCTAFVSLGQSIMNTFIYDYQTRFPTAWWSAVGVPFVFYIVGARNFIEIIGLSGGVLGGVSGLLLVIAYERARFSAHLAKRTLAVPRIFTTISFIVFFAMIVLTLVDFWEV